MSPDSSAPKAAILCLNFGEPETPTLEHVLPFLERIFYTNASLESQPTDEARRARSRELAEQRAPGLMAEYEEIGGSPLNAQARAEAAALKAELHARGYPVEVYTAFQYTEPLIADVVRQAREDGVEHLVGLTVYPLCGHSTNVASLDDVARAVETLGWEGVTVQGITGWHRHPDYLAMRADAIRRTLEGAGLDLANPRTRLVFSAHGTPIKYLEAGSGYGRYVEEFCREVAALLGLGDGDYSLGFQNHTNRRIAWTEPDIETVIETVDADIVIVDPVSFMHEQSETLAELDHELREAAEARGLGFHRVPVPLDDPRYPQVLADLMVPFLDGIVGTDTPSARGLRFGPCRCRPKSGTFCLNSVPRTVAAPAPQASPTSP
jgi:protoporphyrin/coproporphyrin ferrochelatase